MPLQLFTFSNSRFGRENPTRYNFGKASKAVIPQSTALFEFSY
ncbi:hypothetical protein [Amazonocrinis nigriterrae]|nr:hypothetical protein [Amazonocrinis nigriterrae]